MHKVTTEHKCTATASKTTKSATASKLLKFIFSVICISETNNFLQGARPEAEGQNFFRSVGSFDFGDDPQKFRGETASGFKDIYKL